MNLEEKVKKVIRDVPDFPRQGIIFKDITPILADSALCRDIVKHLAAQVEGLNLDGIAGIESRGFIFGPAVAYELDIPFILIRKKGKLPWNTVSQTYNLEYGTAEIEMHVDAVKEGQNILVHDDVLATGGTAAATAELILKQNAHVAGFNFLVDLSFLNGRTVIRKYSENISNLVGY